MGHPDDARILGDDEYVARLSRPPTASNDAPCLHTLASGICDRHGISVDLLRSKASLRSLTPIRMELLDQAITSGTANLSEVARYLGRSPSTLCRQWQKMQKMQ
jgi:DNA-binding NtrC family response regulator